MQNYCKTIGALAAASALVAGTASAQTDAAQAGFTKPGQITAENNSYGPNLEYSLHTGYTSEYLFRGQIFGSDLVEAGVDVAGEYRGFGVAAGAWYATFQNDTALGKNTDDELDMYAEISKDFGVVSAAVGYIYYNYPSESARDTQEVYGSISSSFMGYDVSLTHFWDIVGDNDGYSELYAGKAWELSPCLTLNTGATLGYLWEQDDFAHVTAKISLDYTFVESAKISPFVAHAWGLGNDNGLNYQNELVGGAILSVNF